MADKYCECLPSPGDLLALGDAGDSPPLANPSTLNLCGERVLYVGSSIAHHCNFVTLKSETGALLKTCKAYGSVRDPCMFFPDANFSSVVEREVARNRPSVVILQSSSVDITVLKEKQLSWRQMVLAAKKSSSDIYFLAQTLSTDPRIKRIILSERTPRIDSARNTRLTQLANEELHRLRTRVYQVSTCTKIHIGTHNLHCSTPAEKAAIFGICGMGGRYDGWHLYGPEGPRLYTASVLNILNKAGVALKSFSPASPVSEVEEKENVESSHENVSHGGVQGVPVRFGSTDIRYRPGYKSARAPSSSPASSVSSSDANISKSSSDAKTSAPFDSYQSDIISIWNLDSASVAERLHANFAGTSVSKSITAASVSAESYASVLAKTEAAPHTTKRPAARSTTPKSSSETKTSPESVAAPVIAERLPTNSTETSVSTTAVSVSSESCASVLAKRESVKPMIERAIKVGKYYGLNLKEGIPNMLWMGC